MAKVWVLDTETKGTGASMVPLERARERREGGAEPIFVPPKPPLAPEPAPAPRRPRRFQVVDVLSARTLAEDADLRATLALLRQARKAVDVRICVRDEAAGRWRLLSAGERRALWDASRRPPG